MFAVNTDDGACGLVNVGCHITQAMGNIYESVLFSIADAMIGAVLGLVGVIWHLIETTTTPNLTAGYVYSWTGRLFAISLVVIVAFFALQVITSLLRFRSPSAAMSALPRAGFAVLGTAASLPIIAGLSRASDALSRDLAKVGSGSMDNLGSSVAASLSRWFASTEGFATTAFAMSLSPGFGATGAALVAIVFVFLLGVGLFLVWAALLIRSMLLIVAAVLAPIAIMGIGWEATQNWFRTWAAATVALIITKPVIVIIFGLGTAAMETLPDASTPAAAFGQLGTAGLMLALAGLAPLACFKLVDFLGEQAVSGQHMGTAAAGASVVSKPAAAAKIPIQAGLAAATGGTGAAAVAATSGGGGGTATTILSDPSNDTTSSAPPPTSTGPVTAPSLPPDTPPASGPPSDPTFV